MDAVLCDRFFPDNRSLAYANLASAVSRLGDWSRAKNAAEKAEAFGLQEGNLPFRRDVARAFGLNRTSVSALSAPSVMTTVPPDG
jgi:hypothetical protein